jgi:hypothetical protein
MSTLYAAGGTVSGNPEFRVGYAAAPVRLMLFRCDRGKSLLEFAGDVTADACGLVHTGAGVPFDEDF